jgi:transposase-like protein
MKEAAVAAESLLFDDWFDAIEDGVRARVRGFIETMLEEELSGALSRPRYGRRKPDEEDGAPTVVGVRHGHRERTLTGTFGKTRIAVPRARLTGADGKTSEWKSGSLRAYQRRTKAADALIAGAYLSGTNTRRVRRALAAVFAGPVGKDVVSRTWRKVKGDWDAWNGRSLGEEPIVRLILDGTVVRVRLDRKATSISLLVALGVRADGQKVLLAIRSMGGESEAAWRALLDDLVRRGLKMPELVIVDGAPGLLSGWSPTTCDHTAPRSGSLGSNAGMSAGDGRTIELRIRISRRGGGSARCSGSRARAQPRNFFPHTPPSTTPSTSNAISSQPTRTARFAPRR